MLSTVATLLLSLSAVPAGELAADAAAKDHYVPLVDYRIQADVDAGQHRVNGKAIVRFQNAARAPIRELWWHLYLNAFRNNRSTFMIESKGGRLRGDKFDQDAWGFIEVKKMRARPAATPSAPFQDILGTATFEQPDDGNPEDRTVLRTGLPFSIEPGSAVEVELEFVSQLPRVFARSGYANDFMMVAQWFPKLGVLEDSYRNFVTTSTVPQWNCHQYHAHSEYFADYGSFHVEITVDENAVVGATGSRIETRKLEGGKQLLIHEQDRVHDFSFAVDPRFIATTRTFRAAEQVTGAELRRVAELLDVAESELELPDVEVTLLLQPEHTGFRERYFRATFAAIKWFGLWYGPYPYPVLTVIDGPRTARGAMGMEYPTLITGGSSWPGSKDVASPEVVTIHEFGHQYWYGLVGTNEFEESWLDEGFNTYSTGKVLDEAYEPFVLAPRLLGLWLTPFFSGVRSDFRGIDRLRTLFSADDDQLVRRSWEYRNSRSYGVNSYPRSALTLHQLEKTIGEVAMARVMRTYHQRYRFKHPRTEDFVEVAREIGGPEVEALLERTVYRVGAIDYGVSKLTSKKRANPRGWFEAADANADGLNLQKLDADDDEKKKGPYETVVEVERRGEVDHPVTLELRFDGGQAQRFEWDGKYRWKRFEVKSSTKATSAVLHPDGELPIDINRTNDARTTKSDARPAVVWGAHAVVFVETLLQMIGGLL